MMVSNGSDEGFCEEFKAAADFQQLLSQLWFSMVKTVKSPFHFHGSFVFFLRPYRFFFFGIKNLFSFLMSRLFLHVSIFFF
jgi:hypothetical protein